MLWWHLRNLRSGSPSQQLRAAQRLGSYRDAKAITALKDVLGRWSNRGDDVKAAACVSLEKVADSQAVEALASVFRWGAGDPLFQVAAECLGRMGGAEAMSVLLQVLEDSIRYGGARQDIVMDQLRKHSSELTTPRHRALFAVGAGDFTGALRIDPEAVGFLVQVLCACDNTRKVQAAEALAAGGGDRAVIPLFEAALNGNYVVTQVALDALVRLGPKCVGPLIDVIRDGGGGMPDRGDAVNASASQSSRWATSATPARLSRSSACCGFQSRRRTGTWSSKHWANFHGDLPARKTGPG